MGTLYVVATPIGNLEDITLRALRVLKQVQLIATEDTRTTGRLLKHFEINCPLISYHDYSKSSQVDQILATLDQGDVALVSEAGTPLVSDPGYQLIQAAIAQNIPVTPIPGPNALAAALSVCGLPVDKFLFLGFLPRKTTARRQQLEEVASQPVTLVFFEAPHRLLATLNDMIELLGAARMIVVCRELTKLHEEIWRGTLADAHDRWSQVPPRGEFTLVVAGATIVEAWLASQVEAALTELLDTGLTTKDAVRQVASQSGWSKNEVYSLALQVRKR